MIDLILTFTLVGCGAIISLSIIMLAGYPK